MRSSNDKQSRESMDHGGNPENLKPCSYANERRYWYHTTKYTVYDHITTVLYQQITMHCIKTSKSNTITADFAHYESISKSLCNISKIPIS